MNADSYSEEKKLWIEEEVENYKRFDTAIKSYGFDQNVDEPYVYKKINKDTRFTCLRNNVLRHLKKFTLTRMLFWLLLPAWLAYIMDISLYISNLAGIQEGKDAIVEEGGIVALVEAIEDESVKGKDFAVLTLL
ncbi:U-box domain-containing protein 2 [Cucumis melo var. makuwa]|uniref:U-box domain-containing protein 2 n=1 Tax=Cucumis melo var. makuwa TaxID=1194695 RepID=A0A5A7STN7_CUCMM|nr:U-box domain-containing protein 2 [Cucumis melo var. makuwa]